jgi:hypothetical protein
MDETDVFMPLVSATIVAPQRLDGMEVADNGIRVVQVSEENSADLESDKEEGEYFKGTQHDLIQYKGR